MLLIYPRTLDVASLKTLSCLVCSHSDDSNASHAQMLAEAKSAFSKVTMELSIWLSAQNDCAVRRENIHCEHSCVICTS